jgi:hypothetical protein
MKEVDGGLDMMGLSVMGRDRMGMMGSDGCDGARKVHFSWGGGGVSTQHLFSWLVLKRAIVGPFICQG